jgi:hypothetical protein
MNRVNDAAEDINGDGVYNTRDCTGQPPLIQNQGADLNHQHFCDAFASQNIYPVGCPSSTHSTPTGTLTQITTSVLFDDGSNGFVSCSNAPGNGDLSVRYDSSTKFAYWSLKGGYIANNQTMSKQDVIDNQTCVNACKNDPNCVASYAKRWTAEAYDCLTMYHSDNITNYEYLCGVTTGSDPNEARDLCLAGLGVVNRWHAQCP